MRTIRVSSLALLAVLATPAAGVAATPKVTVSSVSASSATVSVKGKVSGVAKAKRSTARVTLTLTDSKGTVDRFTAKVTSAAKFSATRETKLAGALTLRARLTLKGKKVGALIVKPGVVSVGSSSSEATPLIGTFKLDPGFRRTDGTHVGTYFQMLTPGGGTPLKNSDSGSTNKDFTTLPPGVDGGLRTYEYQAPPVPAFSAGNALGNRIIDPQKFFNYRFTIVTAENDPQGGLPTKLPEIVAKDGKLSGQLTAWAAQWNEQSFNQGTPKPDGSLPGATTPLSGSYDEASRRFVLVWKSLIVGGPFDSFIGSWHLEGTFEPRA